MGNSLSREKFFKENDINPYKVIGVSKNFNKKELKTAYKKKALLLHPDKKSDKHDDLEFKMLNECYKYLLDKFEEIEDFQHKETPNHNVLKEKFKVSSAVLGDQLQERNFYTTNFNDPDIRKTLFVNDTLNFDKFEEKIKSKANNPTEYSAVKTVNIPKIFDDKKFNLKKFNKTFEEQFTIEPDEKPEVTSLEAYSSLSLMPVSTYNGIMIENDKNINTRFQKYDELELLLKTNKNKKKKNNKNKYTDKVNDLYNKRKNEEVTVDTSKTFAEAESMMYENQINNMRNEMKNNRDYVLKNINIYPQNVISQFNQGLLEDSSTCINGNILDIPTGIRKS